jgi:hypothetical protein
MAAEPAEYRLGPAAGAGVTAAPFTPGRQIVWRHFQGPERLALLKVAHVVADDERGLLIWVAQGSPMLDRMSVDRRGLRSIPFEEWFTTETRLWDVTWEGPGILKLFPPTAAHSVWWFWRPDGGFRGWYVNLEEAGVRWDDGDIAGIDVCDQDLDVWAEPDRSWRWKDEEEFAERLAAGAGYWVSDEAEVRAEGLRVIKQIEAGEFPFDGAWCDYRPDPAWPVPDRVPAGWDRPRARH